eukprot:4600111-Pleurochrysis_carterae.AAC.1
MDNSAAVERADHAGASKKTRHYKHWEYYLRECRLDGSIKAYSIRTRDQVADCLTKVHNENHVPQAAPAFDSLNTETTSLCRMHQFVLERSDLSRLFEANDS